MPSNSSGHSRRRCWCAHTVVTAVLGLALSAASADAQRDAFSPIIKSGPNSRWPWRILGAHYDRRNRTLRTGELVIFDVGRERDHYVSDVGRTFPVDARSTPRQRELEEMVRRVSDAVIAVFIEDEILITATGSENLTVGLPRDAAGLEALRQGIVLAPTRPDTGPTPSRVGAPPTGLIGRFADDYGNNFRIAAERFEQLPRSRFHVVEWNARGQFLIARNDDANPGDAGLWTRIDWMRLDGMAPYVWGFCITAYRAASEAAARATAPPDRSAPRLGCSGYPFSRLKPAP